MGDMKGKKDLNEEFKVEERCEPISTQLKKQFNDKFSVDIDEIEKLANSNDEDSLKKVFIKETDMKELMHELNIDPMSRIPLLLFFALDSKAFYSLTGEDLYKILGPLFEYPKNMLELADRVNLMQYNVEFDEPKMVEFQNFWNRMFAKTYDRLQHRLKNVDEKEIVGNPKSIEFFVFQYKKHYDAIVEENEARLALIERERKKRMKQLEEQEGSIPLADAYRRRIAQNEEKKKDCLQKGEQMKEEASNFKRSFLEKVKEEKKIRTSAEEHATQEDDDSVWVKVHHLCTVDHVEKRRRRFQ
eukprot:CAMPEP_0117425708 /NCGR_PEP_ID=MMETSP0758-20121206/5957_1 /TAXON_ID=63605 /ORGANISM="Percolomonas cosmopolitus, Strain AE-1 (ATCC 50343)" /LENGTH=300 /DNA_ID=CAMNT_0005210417 /DNA_START=19 /DNA_END=918 /DNA_ORIENTATION=-